MNTAFLHFLPNLNWYCSWNINFNFFYWSLNFKIICEFFFVSEKYDICSTLPSSPLPSYFWWRKLHSAKLICDKWYFHFFIAAALLQNCLLVFASFEFKNKPQNLTWKSRSNYCIFSLLFWNFINFFISWEFPFNQIIKIDFDFFGNFFVENK